MTDRAEELYLDLLARTLTGMTYEDPPLRWHDPDPDPASYHHALRTGRDIPLPGPAGYQEERRAAGKDVPQHAPSMIGLERLGNIRYCTGRVLADGVPGDLADCGTWRGGSGIFMRALLKVHGVTDRDVWVADSFAGLPDGGPGQDFLAVPLEEVRHNFGLYGMLDDQVRFLPGWFRDTLPGPVGRLAVLRFDGDLYVSARDVLAALYPRLSGGGYLIVDDPGFPGVGLAVREYREEHGITAPYRQAGPHCSYWRKGETAEDDEHPD
jgi:Macrocin-O-methyltransferase (TylF)